MSLNVTAFNHVEWDRFGLANYEDFADRISECNVGEDTFSGSGEWFFIPAPDVRVDEHLILSHEPIRRGGGKPHLCEELYRDGGTTVYVCDQYPNGLTGGQYRKLLKRNPDAAHWAWQVMRRNPIVVVRGKITHPDHATIRLDGWHRVVLNTETGSSSVAFLD